MTYTEKDFETIYHATYPRLSRFVFRRTRVVADGEELLQDIYYALYKRMLSSEETIENVQAYLMQSADHALARYYGKLAKDPVTLTETEESLMDGLSAEGDMETEALDAVSSELIWAEIASWDEPDPSLLVARYRFDMDYPQIAELYGMPVTTVKSRVYNAIERLKHKFLK